MVCMMLKWITFPLAIIGQVGTSDMNWDSFQELNENPMFADVSVYNRTVMTASYLM